MYFDQKDSPALFVQFRRRWTPGDFDTTLRVNVNTCQSSLIEELLDCRNRLGVVELQRVIELFLFFRRQWFAQKLESVRKSLHLRLQRLGLNLEHLGEFC